MIHFSNIICIAFFTLELVHKVGQFTFGKGGDGISQLGVRASERLGEDVDGTCLAAGTDAGEGSFHDGGGMRAED